MKNSVYEVILILFAIMIIDTHTYSVIILIRSHFIIVMLIVLLV